MLPADTGRPWSRHTLLDGFQRLLSQTQVTEQDTINWHTLRHSAASLWIKAGAQHFVLHRILSTRLS